MIYKSLREDTFEYYGKEGLSKLNVPDDFKEKLKSNLYKDCETFSGQRGIIIGVEYCYKYNDCHYIVWIPAFKDVKYESIDTCYLFS